MGDQVVRLPWGSEENLLYGPTIPAAVQGNLPFVDFVPTPQAAIAAGAQMFPQKAEFGTSTPDLRSGKW